MVGMAAVMVTGSANQQQSVNQMGTARTVFHNPGEHLVTSAMTARPIMEELQPALDAVRTLPHEELPSFLADLEEIRVRAWVRLTSPAPSQHVPDELIDANEAGRRLGVSPQFLYRHSKTLPFTRRIGRGLRFSANGIEEFIKRGSLMSTRRPIVAGNKVTKRVAL